MTRETRGLNHPLKLCKESNPCHQHPKATSCYQPPVSSETGFKWMTDFFLLLSDFCWFLFAEKTGKKSRTRPKKLKIIDRTEKEGKKNKRVFPKKLIENCFGTETEEISELLFFGGSCCGEKKLLKTENQEKIHSVKKSWAETKHIFGVSGEVIIWTFKTFKKKCFVHFWPKQEAFKPFTVSCFCI